MNLILYLLASTSCLSIAYLAFRLVFKHSTDFLQQRLFLIVAIVVSLILPLGSYSLEITGWFGKPSMTAITVSPLMSYSNEGHFPATEHNSTIDFISLFIRIYLFIALIFITSIIFRLIKILNIFRSSIKNSSGYYFIRGGSKADTPFSFFSWIFIPEHIRDQEEIESILTHESIHVSQYHSFDNLLVELLAAAMWFNPLVWMMKKSLQLIHEYLADEGTLRSGIDSIRYQTILLNRVAEEKLICLSSSFNQSLIKKRMIMMTKSRTNQCRRFKILTILPLSAILFAIVALLNGFFPHETKAETYTTVLIEKAVPVSGSLISFQTDTIKGKKLKVREIKEGKKSELKDVKVTGYGIKKTSDSLIYVVDGSQVKEISSLNPDSIESMDVRKDDNLIIIRSKEFARKHQDKTISISNGKVSSDGVVFIIDGKESPKSVVDALDPNNIESMEVITNDTIVRKAGYGDHREGIIKITLKKKTE